MGQLLTCLPEPTTRNTASESDILDATTVSIDVTQDLATEPVDAMAQWLIYWRKALFPCRHLRLNPSEGKHFCPDCNEALVLTWVQLRCGSCRRRLPAIVLRSAHGDGLVCPDRCCSQCGTSFVPASHETAHNQTVIPQAIEVDVIHDPQVFHLSHAVLAMRPANHLAQPWPVSVLPEPLSVLIERALLCVLLLMWSVLGQGLKAICYEWLLPAFRLLVQTLCEPSPSSATMAAD